MPNSVSETLGKTFSDPKNLAGLGALGLVSGGIGAFSGLNGPGSKAQRRKAALRNALAYGAGGLGAGVLGLGGLSLISDKTVGDADVPMSVHFLQGGITGAGGAAAVHGANRVLNPDRLDAAHTNLAVAVNKLKTSLGADGKMPAGLEGLDGLKPAEIAEKLKIAMGANPKLAELLRPHAAPGTIESAMHTISGSKLNGTFGSNLAPELEGLAGKALRGEQLSRLGRNLRRSPLSAGAALGVGGALASGLGADVISGGRHLIGL